jgi:hypothetical protein
MRNKHNAAAAKTIASSQRLLTSHRIDFFTMLFSSSKNSFHVKRLYLHFCEYARDFFGPKGFGSLDFGF